MEDNLNFFLNGRRPKKKRGKKGRRPQKKRKTKKKEDDLKNKKWKTTSKKI